MKSAHIIGFINEGKPKILWDNLEPIKIKKLDTYFDSPITLAKKFGLRGIPTTILLNKDGLEFARIVGSINFENEEFIRWLSNFN